MEQIKLTAQIRKQTGKGEARKLRQKGLIPAIFYGPRSKPIPLSLDFHHLKKSLGSELRENMLINLMIKDGKKEIEKVTMLKDLQLDPFKKDCLHADFYEVALDEKITVSVPIHLKGRAEGVKEGGILEQVVREIEIRCFPSQIPGFLEVDISELRIGDSLHVKDLKLGEEIEVLTEEDLTIVTVVAPLAEEEVSKEEAEAALARSLAPKEGEVEKEE